MLFQPCSEGQSGQQRVKACKEVWKKTKSLKIPKRGRGREERMRSERRVRKERNERKKRVRQGKRGTHESQQHLKTHLGQALDTKRTTTSSEW